MSPAFDSFMLILLMSKIMFPLTGMKYVQQTQAIWATSALMHGRHGNAHLWNAIEQDAELQFEPGQVPSTVSIKFFIRNL